jgi:hypothetical protein
MATKQIEIAYQAKNNTTGLVDVKAQCYFNGTAKATGSVGSPITLTEQDATNSPGLYVLTIPAATLTTWGVTTGQSNTVTGYINSVTQPARAPFREEVQVYDSDDIEVLLGTPAGASVSADILTANTAIAAVKVDLESGTNSLANILAAITAIQNNAGFSIPFAGPFVIPSSGSNAYLIPLTFYNSVNTLIDPDSNTVTMALVNQSGTSRGSYLGATTAVRVSAGRYTVAISVPSTAIEEQWTLSASYSIGGAATVRNSVADVILDILAAGTALQSTLLATQTTVGTINTAIANGTYGLSALQTQGATTSTNVLANNTILSNGTYGLSALQSLLANGTYGLNALLTAISAGGSVGGRAV